MTTDTMKIHMVDVLSQYRQIQQEIDEAVLEVVRSGAYINGPAVKSFAANLETYLDAGHVLPCGNGTDALQIALMALDLQPGDEVITPSFTFIATAEVISLLRLKPVFADVDPTTFNMDPDHVESLITPKTKCILPVHLYGLPADMARLVEVAEKHGIPVVEDTAQAIGASYTMPDGSVKKAGTIGAIGTTSFYPSKNLGAYGDGGAIFTDSDELATMIRQICNHGSKVRYHHDIIGVNSRLDSIQATILDIKLRHLDDYNTKRNEAAATYSKLLANIPGIIVPTVPDNSTHAYHQYTIRIEGGAEKRNNLQKALGDKNIPSMIYYPIPLHLQNCFADMGGKKGDLPVTEQLTDEVISLPMHSELNTEQIEYIADSIINLL